MKSSEFKNSNSVESYDEKTVEITTLWKSAYFPNYQRYPSQILIAQIEEFNED